MKPSSQGHKGKLEQRPGFATFGFGASAHSSTKQLVPENDSAPCDNGTETEKLLQQFSLQQFEVTNDPSCFETIWGAIAEVVTSLGLSFHTEKIETRTSLLLVGRIKELGIKMSITEGAQ